MPGQSSKKDQVKQGAILRARVLRFFFGGSPQAGYLSLLPSEGFRGGFPGAPSHLVGEGKDEDFFSGVSSLTIVPGKPMWIQEAASEMKNGKSLKMWGLIMGLCVMMSGQALAGHGEKREPKKAILLAAFGTTVPEARKALDHIDVRVREAFPEIEVRWAYTSGIVRKRLAAQGKVFHSPETAMAGLMDEGYTHVAVLSLHTIPGEEFHRLYQNAQLFQKMARGFEQVLVALPLLSSSEDMFRSADALLQSLPAERKGEDAVIFMGHGSKKHPADGLYLAMNQVLQDRDPNAFMGSVAGYPTLDDLLPKLRARDVQKVYLVPFMAVAGDHAVNDMAGDEPDSWKSVLEQEGYTVEAILRGTAEIPDVVQIWVDHLKIAVAHFKTK